MADPSAGPSAASPQLVEIASYAPSLLVARAGLPSPLIAPEAQALHAAVMFADVSGFTRLTESLAEAALGSSKARVDGAEQLTRIINRYFQRMIDVIRRHGGDVVKFAGDAMLVLFRCEKARLREAGLAASACALALQAECGEYTATPTVTLRLHIGVGAGALCVFLVGGARDRWEVVAAGQPITQVGAAEGSAEPGDVVLSKELSILLRDDTKCFRLRDGLMKLRTISTTAPPLAPPPPTPLADSMSRTLQLFLPGAVREQLVGGGAGLRYLSELRRVSTLFINVRLPDEAKAAKATPQVTRAASDAASHDPTTTHSRPTLFHR